MTVLLLAVAASLAQAPEPRDSTRMPPPQVSSLILAPPVNLSALSQSSSNPTAFKTIATHTAIGTGAGLLIGLLLSASATDDESTVVLTWTAIGAGAGLVSGVITWLLGRGV